MRDYTQQYLGLQAKPKRYAPGTLYKESHGLLPRFLLGIAVLVLFLAALLFAALLRDAMVLLRQNLDGQVGSRQTLAAPHPAETRSPS